MALGVAAAEGRGMHFKWFCTVLMSACAAMKTGGAAGAASPSPASQAEDPAEIVVRGARLRDLKAAITKAEDRFYEKYNELNEEDDFDIECRVQPPLGTRIPGRSCLTRLQLEAKADFGREYLQNLQDMSKFGTVEIAKPPDTNPEAIWAARYDDYRANMLALLRAHPDLLALARAGETARKRYESEYGRRMRQRISLPE